VYCHLKKATNFQPPDYFGRFLNAVEDMEDKEIAAELRERQKAVTVVLGKLFILGSFSGWIAGAGITACVVTKLIFRGGVRETPSIVTNDAYAAGVHAYNIALIADSY